MRRFIGPEVKEEAFQMWSLPLERRECKRDSDLAARLHISLPTLLKYKKEFVIKSGVRIEDYNSNKYFESRSSDIDAALMESVKKGNSASLKLAYQLQGKLVEKTEVDHRFGLTAEQHAKVREEARRRVAEISERTDGDRGLLPESVVFPIEVWEDKGAESGDN